MLNKLVFKPEVLFPANMAVMLMLVVIADKFILNSDFYAKAFNNTGIDWNTILISTAPKFKTILYTASVLLLFLKYSLISLLTYTTFYLNAIKVSYLAIFKIVCAAEMVFLIPAMMKVIWFLLYPPTDLRQWAEFYPLSIYSVFSGAHIPTVIAYPLQLLNAFELIYIITFAYLLQKLVKNNFDDVMKIVLISYLPGLFVWTLIAAYYNVMLHHN